MSSRSGLPWLIHEKDNHLLIITVIHKKNKLDRSDRESSDLQRSPWQPSEAVDFSPASLLSVKGSPSELEIRRGVGGFILPRFTLQGRTE